ncbi:MAG: WYL domain-containing protein [Clostridia bacterium]|nr:WYL domain-containing protein [Clostridia bacterium]
MARGERQKEKLIRILEILMKQTDEEHGISVAELISQLSDTGISAERKSVYDDFLVLSDIGFTVEKLPTRPVTYYLADRIFELAELKMLVDAVESSKFITAAKSRDIISKLEIFAGQHRSRELARQVYVEDRVKTMSSAAIYNVDAIHSAINANKRISFKYFEYTAEKKRVFRHGGERYEASPAALIWSEENYYLVAYDGRDGQRKNFRVDKMADITVLDLPRCDMAVAERFNPASYARKIFGMYGGREELVTLECRESLAGVIIDRFGQEPTFVKTDFGFKVSLRVMVSPTFFAWVLGFGKDMRILSPSSVVEEIKRRIKEVGELYE